MASNYNNAIILLSGGQDSTTSLFWAKERFDNILAVIIDYGQKHSIEIRSALRIAKMANVTHKIIELPFIKDIGDSSLVGNGKDVSAPHQKNKDLPSSFVPGRNLIFLSVAAMIAYKYNVSNVITGVCHVDFSGYPDCREGTILSLTETLQLGMQFKEPFHIFTPLMHLTKAEIVQLAQTLPGCMEALKYSHTCYNGKNPPCRDCPACKLRAKGFEEAGVIDPLIG